MTKWLPNIKKPNGPIYIAIADAIETDIQDGILPVGTKLPPQRNVAYDIGVTIGTISRGYALACERGLVSGEVGRGTYVIDKEDITQKTLHTFPESEALPYPKDDGDNSYHLGFASAVDVGQSEIISKTAGKIAQGHPTKIMDYIREVPSHWREAGKHWLSCNEWQPETENIVPTNGAMAAGVAAISSVSAPGDKIVMEGLTYCSIARSATLLGRRIIVTDFDKFGIIPEAFERVCAQQHPKILFIMPSLQNPTLAVLSRERRIAIAEIAHRYNVWIIEDMIYAPLVEDETPPIAHFAPERTFHVGGLSKCVSAGLRSGWVACPPRFADRIANAHKMLTGGASYWLTELASTLTLNGEAHRVLKLIKAENQKRHGIASNILKDNKFKSHPNCPYIWIKLPDPWHSGTFKNALAKHNIIVSGEDDFKPARTDQVFHGARIGLSSVASAQELEEPLKIIQSLLESGIAGYDIRD